MATFFEEEGIIRALENDYRKLFGMAKNPKDNEIRHIWFPDSTPSTLKDFSQKMDKLCEVFDDERSCVIDIPKVTMIAFDTNLDRRFTKFIHFCIIAYYAKKYRFSNIVTCRYPEPSILIEAELSHYSQIRVNIQKKGDKMQVKCTSWTKCGTLYDEFTVGTLFMRCWFGQEGMYKQFYAREEQIKLCHKCNKKKVTTKTITTGEDARMQVIENST